MMKGKMGAWHLITALILAAALIFAGCAGVKKKAQPAPQEVFACAPDDKIEKMIDDAAELEEFSCSMKKWEGAPTLHFKVAVKNAAATPQRFRVNIFMDNGKAVGGLIPRTTGSGLVAPGASASFVYPVKGMSAPAEGIILKIDPIAQ